MDQWLSTRRQFLGSASLLLAGCATVPRVVMPVDPNATAMPDLVDLARFDPRLRLDIRYATPDKGASLGKETTELDPVVAMVFGQSGLIAGATLSGTKYTRIIP